MECLSLFLYNPSCVMIYRLRACLVEPERHAACTGNEGSVWCHSISVDRNRKTVQGFDLHLLPSALRCVCVCVSNFSLTLKIAPPAKGSVLLMHLRDGLWCANLLLQEFDPLEKQHGNAWKDFSLFVGAGVPRCINKAKHNSLASSVLHSGTS